MAPVTRSKSAKATDTPPSGAKSKKSKAPAPSKPAAASSSTKPAGVQKSKDRKKKTNKKSTSQASSSSPPKPTTKPSKASKRDARAQRTTDDEDAEDFPELTHAYSILPHLNNASGSPRASAGTLSSKKSNSSGSLKYGAVADWQRVQPEKVFVSLLSSSPSGSAARSRQSSQRASGSDLQSFKQQPVSSSSPSTAVSVRNAEVFNRPTVGTVRQERAELIQQIDRWDLPLHSAWVLLSELVPFVTESMDLGKRSARESFARVVSDFDGVLQEMKERRRILWAINKVQGPFEEESVGEGKGEKEDGAIG